MSCVLVRLAIDAMATRFELVLAGADDAADPARDEVRLRAAGEAALDAISDTEARLSRFASDSFTAQVGRTPTTHSLRTDPLDREWLVAADELRALTSGAFDLCHLGPGHLVLAEDGARVRRSDPDTRLDCGAIGKGVALDRARDELLDAGVTRALLHGGTSTVLALGAPPGRAGWGVRIDLVAAGLVDVELCDRALSVSAQRGQDRLPEGGHVVDARTGTRSRALEVVACTADRATLADAWSTALVAAGPAPDLLAAAARHGVALVDPVSNHGESR